MRLGPVYNAPAASSTTRLIASEGAPVRAIKAVQRKPVTTLRSSLDNTGAYCRKPATRAAFSGPLGHDPCTRHGDAFVRAYALGMVESAARTGAAHWRTASYAAAIGVLSITGGAVGALGLWWAQGKSADQIGAVVGLLSTVVVVVGWFLSTDLNAAVQRELLHLQLLNEARRELVSSFQAEQMRLSGCAAELLAFQRSRGEGHQISVERRRGVRATIDAATEARTAVSWVGVFEQYWSLFPELAGCHFDLAHRSSKISGELFRISLLLSADPQPAELGQALDGLLPHLMDQTALFQDLTFHVQTRTLGAVSGHSAPKRIVPDATVPRLVLGNGRQLRIEVPDTRRRDELLGLGWLTPTED